MAVQIQMRRGVSGDWTTSDPTLAAGEWGLETNTDKFKIGDGSTAWTSLDYSSLGFGTAGGTISGTVNFGADGSGQDVNFYSGTAGDHMKWDASEEQLVITGTSGATALNVVDGNVVIAGDLTVAGTTVTLDLASVLVKDRIVFEGSSADDYETTLIVTNPTGADKTITLPNADGTVALTSTVLALAGGAMTGAITTNSTFDGVDIATRDAVLTSTTTTADAALPKAGGAMTGAITTNSTFDGVDIAVRDAILTSTTTTADAALPKAGGTMTGAIDAGDQIIQKPLLKDVGEVVKTIASSSSDPSLDIHDGNVFKITLDNSPTFTITNATASGSSCTITLFLLQDGTGSRIVTWPSEVKWAGGTAPTLTTTANRYDIIVLTTIDAGGTNWFGAVSGQDFS